MNKNESLALKGVAIIMMLLYHLFYVKRGGDFFPLFYLSGTPLISKFSEICYPVSLYLMLSGYGLYTQYLNKRNPRTWEKIRYLYSHLWIIFLLFLPVACLMYSTSYLGGFWTLVCNLLSIKTTYNVSQWFLFPYIILFVCSRSLFKVLDRIGSLWTIAISAVIFIGYCFLITRLGEATLRNYCGIGVYLIFALSFLLSFFFGAVVKKEHLIEKFKSFTGKHSQSIAICILTIMTIVRLFVSNQSLQPFCMFVLIIVFTSMKFPLYINLTLRYLGKHSMNMWLIHSWLCYYLFKDFYYGFKYPIFIFIATLLSSLIISIIVEFIYKLLTNLIPPKEIINASKT